MSDEPRMQHIIPAFYLAGFTHKMTKRGRLHVIDCHRAKTYPTTPRKAARERDYYRVEEPGLTPYLIEEVLAEHEQVISPFVKQVAEKRRASDRRQVGEALSLAAVISVRSRRSRGRLEAFLARDLAAALADGRVDHDHWERLRASELRNGVAPEAVPRYDQARRGLLDRSWFPKAPRVVMLSTMLDLQEALMKDLHERPWELMRTDSSENGGFITSDEPLVRGDLDAALTQALDLLPSRDSEITFPLSKDVALVSYPNARHSNCDATQEIVAHVNARTLHFSSGMLFHAYGDFLVNRGDQIARGSDFIHHVLRGGESGIWRPALILPN